MKTLRNSEAKTIPARGTTVGLDVGDRYSQFCILDESGEIVAEGRVRTTAETLNEHLARWARSRVVLEAGTSSAWISRLASAAGHEVIVANPRELRKIHQSDRKNDRTDAQILARMARFDPQLLAPITHRSATMQNDLAVVRARERPGAGSHAMRQRCPRVGQDRRRTLDDMQHGKLCPQSSCTASQRARECAGADAEDDRGTHRPDSRL